MRITSLQKNPARQGRLVSQKEYKNEVSKNKESPLLSQQSPSLSMKINILVFSEVEIACFLFASITSLLLQSKSIGRILESVCTLSPSRTSVFERKEALFSLKSQLSNQYSMRFLQLKLGTIKTYVTIFYTNCQEIKN